MYAKHIFAMILFSVSCAQAMSDGLAITYDGHVINHDPIIVSMITRAIIRGEFKINCHSKAKQLAGAREEEDLAFLSKKHGTVRMTLWETSRIAQAIVQGKAKKCLSPRLKKGLNAFLAYKEENLMSLSWKDIVKARQKRNKHIQQAKNEYDSSDDDCTAYDDRCDMGDALLYKREKKELALLNGACECLENEAKMAGKEVADLWAEKTNTIKANRQSYIDALACGDDDRLLAAIKELDQKPIHIKELRKFGV